MAKANNKSLNLIFMLSLLILVSIAESRFLGGKSYMLSLSWKELNSFPSFLSYKQSTQLFVVQHQ